MPNFKPDNPFLHLDLSVEALSCLSAITCLEAMRPENVPLLTEVEAVREKGAPIGAPQVASRYCVVFPGSDYLRISIKVDEAAPSISPELLKKYPRGIPVQVQGFFSGTFLTKDGGAMPYFKAGKIVPMQTQGQPAK